MLPCQKIEKNNLDEWFWQVKNPTDEGPILPALGSVSVIFEIGQSLLFVMNQDVIGYLSKMAAPTSEENGYFYSLEIPL